MSSANKLLIGCFSIIAVLAGGLTLEYILRPAGNAFLAFTEGDYETAIDHLQTSIDKGDVESITSLANIYRFGLGVPEDHYRAALLYEKAARAGSLAAQVNLGHMYRLGLGVELDGKIAYAWYNLARNGGQPQAQLYMSELLHSMEVRGHFVPEIKTKYATIKNLPVIEAEQ